MKSPFSDLLRTFSMISSSLSVIIYLLAFKHEGQLKQMYDWLFSDTTLLFVPIISTHKNSLTQPSIEFTSGDTVAPRNLRPCPGCVFMCLCVCVDLGTACSLDTIPQWSILAASLLTFLVLQPLFSLCPAVWLSLQPREAASCPAQAGRLSVSLWLRRPLFCALLHCPPPILSLLALHLSPQVQDGRGNTPCCSTMARATSYWCICFSVCLFIASARSPDCVQRNRRVCNNDSGLAYDEEAAAIVTAAA